jgi:hypothetical protein
MHRRGLEKFVYKTKISEKSALKYFEEFKGPRSIQKCTIRKCDSNCNWLSLWKSPSLESASPFVKRNSRLLKQTHSLEIGSAASPKS